MIKSHICVDCLKRIILICVYDIDNNCTEAKINEAMNGVLFIDKAYRLSGSAESGSAANYGEEAISVLLK